jgi:DNA repair exonuclease SbcCD ATPase subunit
VAAQKLITKHKTLETELIAHEHEYDVVAASGENLVEAEHAEAALVQKRLAELEQLWTNVKTVR